MKNHLSEIFSSLEEIEPGIEWAAFELSGGADEFQGFGELDVCVNGTTSQSKSGKLAALLNNDDNTSAILDAIIPENSELLFVSPASSVGLLLVVIKRSSTERLITIPSHPSCFAESVFRVPPGFRGLMIDYDNMQEDELALSFN